MAQKRTKEERDQEFLDNVEQVFGHNLMDWQKRYLLEIRQATIEGKPLVLDHTNIVRS